MNYMWLTLKPMADDYFTITDLTCTETNDFKSLCQRFVYKNASAIQFSSNCHLYARKTWVVLSHHCNFCPFTVNKVFFMCVIYSKCVSFFLCKPKKKLIPFYWICVTIEKREMMRKCGVYFITTHLKQWKQCDMKHSIWMERNMLHVTHSSLRQTLQLLLMLCVTSLGNVDIYCWLPVSHWSGSAQHLTRQSTRCLWGNKQQLGVRRNQLVFRTCSEKKHKPATVAQKNINNINVVQFI